MGATTTNTHVHGAVQCTHPHSHKKDDGLPGLLCFGCDGSQICTLVTVIYLVTNISAITRIHSKVACKKNNADGVLAWVL